MRQRDEKASNLVENYIKNEIKEDRLHPGSKLPSERELSKMLNVSRTSVREAIKALITIGYLETFERKGTFLSENYKRDKSENLELKNFFNKAPIFDLMEVRIILENNFIPLAVKRAESEDIEKMKKALEKMKNSENNIGEFFYGDLEFHYILGETTHNTVIIELMKIIKDRIIREKTHFMAAGVETREKTIKVFEDIIESIKNKDVEKAQKLYISHLNHVEKFFEESQ
ncbi:MAG: FadR/GntR family transcriptional regulator [Eubacteriales bacterium]